MSITIQRVPWILRLAMPAVWLTPYFALLALRMSTEFLSKPTMWEAIVLPALASLISIGILSAPHVTANPEGLRFWPMRQVQWSEVKYEGKKRLGIEYLKITVAKTQVHRVLLNVRGAKAFVEIVEKHGHG